MTKLTIVYTDGHQEYYNVTEPSSVNALNGMKRFKEVVEDGMLKLVIEHRQIVLIPMSNIRKIISQRSDLEQFKAEDFPGFLNATLVEEF